MRRPDIRAAEAQVRALNARVGLAKASRFPRITLTGSFGYSTSELEELFKGSGTRIVSPLDIRGASTIETYKVALRCLLEDDDVQNIVIGGVLQVPGIIHNRDCSIVGYDKLAAHLVEVLDGSNKPIIFVGNLPKHRPETGAWKFVKSMTEAGYPVYRDATRGVKALANFVEYRMR